MAARKRKGRKKYERAEGPRAAIITQYKKVN